MRWVWILGLAGVLAGAASAAVTVRVWPGTKTIATTDDVDLQALVNGTSDTRVRWSVSAGTLRLLPGNKARFDPPNAVGSYRVTATSVANPRVSGTAVIRTVVTPVRVTLSQDRIITWPGQSPIVTARVTGTSNPAVRWSVEGGRVVPIDATRARVFPGPFGEFRITATSVALPVARAHGVVAHFSTPRAFVQIAVLGSGRGIPNMRMRYFTSSGAFYTATLTTSNGFAQAYLPLNVTGIMPDPASFPRSGGFRIYYTTFGYNGEWYEANISQCRIRLPALRGGSVVRLPNINLLRASGPPPPPPTGC